MLLVPCPYCGSRPEVEFTYGGEAHVRRAVDGSDADLAGFLYVRTNPKGLHAERWRHAHGCGRFFNALRHTVSDKFVRSYRVGEPRPDVEVTPEIAVAGAASGGVDPTRSEVG